MIVYFFIAATHIFFVSPQSNHSKHGSTGSSIFKRKTEVLAGVTLPQKLINRPDKSTFEDKRVTADVINAVLRFFVYLQFIPLLWRLKPKFYTGNNTGNHLTQHNFLSLNVIRI